MRILKALVVAAVILSLAFPGAALASYSNYSYEGAYTIGQTFHSVRASLNLNNSPSQTCASAANCGAELGLYASVGAGDIFVGWVDSTLNGGNVICPNVVSSTPKLVVDVVDQANGTESCTTYSGYSTHVDVKVMKRSSLIHGDYYVFLNGTNVQTVTFPDTTAYQDIVKTEAWLQESNSAASGTGDSGNLAIRYGYCTGSPAWSVSQQAFNQTPYTWTNVDASGWSTLGGTQGAPGGYEGNQSGDGINVIDQLLGGGAGQFKVQWPSAATNPTFTC